MLICAHTENLLLTKISWDFRKKYIARNCIDDCHSNHSVKPTANARHWLIDIFWYPPYPRKTFLPDISHITGPQIRWSTTIRRLLYGRRIQISDLVLYLLILSLPHLFMGIFFLLVSLLRAFLLLFWQRICVSEIERVGLRSASLSENEPPVWTYWKEEVLCSYAQDCLSRDEAWHRSPLYTNTSQTAGRQ
jgi:hypothetical protein